MPRRKTVVHGVRYPENAMKELREAGIEYPWISAEPERATSLRDEQLALHVPRRQYTNGLSGFRRFGYLRRWPAVFPWCVRLGKMRRAISARTGLCLRPTGEAMKAEIEHLLRRASPESSCRERDGNDSADGIHAVIGRSNWWKFVEELNRVKIFVFGSSLTSSYWNGAATYYRGIYKYLHRIRAMRSHLPSLIFTGRQKNRDAAEIDYADVIVYQTPRDH